MPKKHRPQFTLLEGTSSTSPSSATRRSAGDSSSSQRSVNDLLTHLRRSQNAGTAEQRARERELAAVATAPTVHPSLRALLHIPEIPAPRRRRRPRRYGLGERGPAGPPPPLSWLTSSIHAPIHLQEMERRRTISRARPRYVNRLPDLPMPDEHSLLHQCLKTLASNWEWHIVYDQYYLAALPARLKSLLLSYIGVYGSDNGVTMDGLRMLFLSQAELEEATAPAETTHLDLTGAVGRSVTLKQLEQYLFPPVHTGSPSAQTGTGTTDPMFSSKITPPASPGSKEDMSSSTPENNPDPLSDLLDSWEDEADAQEEDAKYNISTNIPQSLNGARFPHLTHLSLSHPGPGATWSRLLSLSTHLATVTHLSLAHWPPPSLTPNSKTATAVSNNSPAVSYGGTTLYSALEDDWLEAASILRRLSRATYCLRWLDLEGCTSWLGALALKNDATSTGTGTGTGTGIEWNGAWRRVEYVNLSQGWLPRSYERRIIDEAQSQSGAESLTLLPRSTLTSQVSHFDDDESDESEARDVSDWIANARLILATAGSIRQRRAAGGSGRIPITVDCGWKGWWIDKEVIGH